MPKPEPKETAKRIFGELIAKFPQEVQDSLKVAFEKAPEEALQFLGEHVLRQDDYSREMDDLRKLRQATETWRGDLSKWQTDHETELTEGQKAIARLKELEAKPGDGGGTGDPGPNPKPPTVDLSGYVRREDVDKLLIEQAGRLTGYSTNFGAYMARLVAQHQKEFGGEILDTDSLVNYCRENNLRIDQGGYDSFVHSKRDEAAKKRHEEDLKAAEERGFRRALSEGSSDLPFPTSGGTVGGGEHMTLAGLGADKGKFDKSTAVSRAVATYQQELQKKAGAGSG